MTFTLYLASKSPRRQALLDQVGLSYKVISVEIDESSENFSSIENYAKAMATQKANIAYKRYGQELNSAESLILSADTTIGFQDEILGKPKDKADFKKMMSCLSNNTHDVYSAICLLKVVGEICESVVLVNRSKVTISHLPDSFIDYYWKSKEPLDKAGGYAIQGMMASFIAEIKGSYSGIMGLPLYELREAFEKLGYNHPLYRLNN